MQDMNIKELFPLTQSFGLVLGNKNDVANAIFNEIKKYTKNENGIELKHLTFNNINEAIYNNKFMSLSDFLCK